MGDDEELNSLFFLLTVSLTYSISPTHLQAYHVAKQACPCEVICILLQAAFTDITHRQPESTVTSVLMLLINSCEQDTAFGEQFERRS